MFISGTRELNRQTSSPVKKRKRKLSSTDEIHELKVKLSIDEALYRKKEHEAKKKKI